MPHTGTWSEAGVLAAAKEFRHDLHVVPGRAAAGTPVTEAAGLTISGEGVVMSSLRRRAVLLELRLVAQRDIPTVAVVEGLRAARRADLLGRPGETLTLTGNRLELQMRPWEMATIQMQLTTVNKVSAASPVGPFCG